MADFIDADLPGARFDNTDLSGAQFRAVDLSGADFRSVDLTGAVLRGVDLTNVDIYGELQNVTVNGVAIVPLVEAELNRRYPERAQMRPSDPAGFRQAWATLVRLWDQTVDRARSLPPARLHEQVDGEWSFIETLRHLVFATDCWVRRAIEGDPAPWHPLGLPWSEMRGVTGVPCDRAARPGLDEVLALRRDRMAGVGQVIAAQTPASLDAGTTPVQAPGWPPARAFPVRQCLLTVLNEEWEHRLYAERDLQRLSDR